MVPGRLAYWIVVSGLGLLDMVNEYVTYWIPFYYLVKFAFILYLVLPQTRGVTVLRELVIKVRYSRASPTCYHTTTRR
jgi:hypothetical protein